MELGAILLLVLVWLSVAGAVHYLVRREWIATWQGHRIIMRNYLMTEQLFIDDQLVASSPIGPRAGSVLTGSIEEDGQAIPVMASLSVGLGRLDVQLFVDGKLLPTTSGRIGALEAAPAPAQIEAAPAPADPRWSAVHKLLASIRTHDTTPDVVALCDQVETQLRQLLLDIEALDEDAEAHRMLATAGGQTHPDDTLAALRANKERQVRELFAAIQRLHLGVLAGEPASQAVSLAQRLTARAEVEATAPQRDDKATKARAARHAHKTRG